MFDTATLIEGQFLSYEYHDLHPDTKRPQSPAQSSPSSDADTWLGEGGDMFYTQKGPEPWLEQPHSSTGSPLTL